MFKEFAFGLLVISRLVFEFGVAASMPKHDAAVDVSCVLSIGL